jgi:predicted secreted protein
MATTAGFGGFVKIGTFTVAEIDDWTLALGAAMLDTTAFGGSGGAAAGWKTFIAGLKDWSVTFKGRWDQTDTNGQAALQAAILGGTTVTIKLMVNGTNAYSGTAFIKTQNVKAAIAGTIDADFAGQGSGALTYA